MTGKYVAYYRVSTARQGRSGLGLEAQREAVRAFLKGGDWELLEEFTEVETGSGRNAREKRPVLDEAIRCAKKHKAKLLIAKLDRLSRNLHFISSLMEEKVRFVAADMPDANELTIHIMAALAQHERKLISERTRAALARVKARGKKLGNPNLTVDNRARSKKAQEFAARLQDTLAAFNRQGMSQRAMVAELNKLRVGAPRGGMWSLVQLQRVLARLRL
jgi:DNA invertase Pin-like site-specific DNA recombinase